MTDVEIARGRARSGDLDGAIDLVSRILNAQFEAGTMMFRAPATTALVETLLARGGPGDVEAAERAIDRLEDVPTEPGFVLHEIPVLRLRALLARVRGDESGYRQFLQGFRAKAQDVQFEGYLAQAEAMDAD
jgi:adenylate cyclase